MHYYSFHIGDFVAATVHLTPMEELAFRRLLDMYYSTEKPIPAETDLVSRRLRLDTELVIRVLKEFFVLGENGWSNKRCDAEILAYRRKAEVAKSNGKLGGRPPKTQSIILANPAETGSKANQEPITNNQEKEKTKRFVPPSLEDVRAYCLERRNGLDPGRFVDNYQSKGWKVGNTAMKDWRAAVRTWERNGDQNGTNNRSENRSLSAVERVERANKIGKYAEPEEIIINPD